MHRCCARLAKAEGVVGPGIHFFILRPSSVSPDVPYTLWPEVIKGTQLSLNNREDYATQYHMTTRLFAAVKQSDVHSLPEHK